MRIASAIIFEIFNYLSFIEDNSDGINKVSFSPDNSAYEKNIVNLHLNEDFRHGEFITYEEGFDQEEK